MSGVVVDALRPMPRAITQVDFRLSAVFLHFGARLRLFPSQNPPGRLLSK